MLIRTLVSIVALAALAATPATVDAAEAVIVPGADAQQLTALDGTVVWVSGSFPTQTLMQRGPDGSIARVTGAPTATYRSIDLGRDGQGELVLTYIRCAGTRNCKAYSDDLSGRRVSFKRLTPQRCQLTAAPARWGSRVAYGLFCSKLGDAPGHDARRTGLFVRKGSAAPKRLRLPKDAVRFGIDLVSAVDLRGTNVGAVVSDVYSYAFSQTVNASRLRSTFVAGSEGESDEHVEGLALGTGGVLWTLVDAIHAGDRNEARISRLASATCADLERLANPPGPGEGEGFRAEALAVDGATIYLFVRGAGIVTHEFAPTSGCR